VHYFDSAALAKLVLEEPESDALQRYEQRVRKTVSSAVLTDAVRLAPASLRSLGAIHLASALLLRDELEAFVAYDECLLNAASALGLPVASPGVG
jgi:hypothetical protein